MILLLAFCLAFIAILLMKQKGSFTQQPKNKIISLVCHLASAVAFINVYGTARGIFIYLAVIALLGMAFILISSSVQPQKDKVNDNTVK